MKNLAKKPLTGFIAAFAFAVLTTFGVAAVPGVASAVCDGKGGVNDSLNCTQGTDTPATLFGEGSVFTTVINTLLFVIAAISVVMLIWGGIRYTTSAGNATNVTAAKNTIMYAIIGLVIAVLAYAIVNWLLGRLTSV